MINKLGVWTKETIQCNIVFHISIIYTEKLKLFILTLLMKWTMVKIKSAIFLVIELRIFCCFFMKVTEFAPYGSLIDRLRSKDISCVATLGQFACQISSGMVYLHSRNLVHRDLSARNILVTGKNLVWYLLQYELFEFLKKIKGTVSPFYLVLYKRNSKFELFN